LPASTADDLRPGAQRLHDDAHAGHQPSPADGDHHRVGLGLLAEDLERERPLPGDDVGVVEGVHEGEPLHLLQPARLGVRLVVVGALQHHPRAVGAGVRDLHDGGGLGHDDGGGHPEPAGVVGHRLRVVAGARGDEAALALGGREQEELVQRPALLVRAGHLQVVELQVRVRAGEPGERLAARAGGEVDAIADADERGADVVERDHVGRAR
jgi:hypothetical protein